jgi:transcriptional regulator with XRE-family HTH domain
MTDERPALRGDDEKKWQELGERLREAREYMGYSQSEVAEALGLPRPAISRFETGQRKVSVLELNRLAELYHRPIGFFTNAQQLDTNAMTTALFRATKDLTDRDQEQVLRFAEFLRNAGAAPEPQGDTDA